MTSVVAHIVRESGLLTEPFIASRVSAVVAGFRSEQWSEVGVAPRGVDLVRVRSRDIKPGSPGARAFHHIPHLGYRQQAEYRTVTAERRPAVIHAHYLTTGVLARRTEFPLVASAYGFDVSVMARRPLWRLAFHDLASTARSVLVEGPHMRTTVVALGFPEDRVHVVRIAVGHEELDYVPPTVVGSRAPRFLAAGRFVAKKGYPIAIRAFAAVRHRYPGATLEIVGFGREEAALRSLVSSLGVEDAVRFSGSLPRPEYLARLSEADVFLAPSVTAPNGDSEGGAPTTILDAQAVGTIAVGSTHADIPFLISDGETGFLAPEGDVDAFVDALERALAAQDRWTSIADAARSAVLRNNGGDSLARSLESVYRDATA